MRDDTCDCRCMKSFFAHFHHRFLFPSFLPHFGALCLIYRANRTTNKNHSNNRTKKRYIRENSRTPKLSTPSPELNWQSHVSSRIAHRVPCDCLANTEENIEKKHVLCHATPVTYVTSITPRKPRKSSGSSCCMGPYAPTVLPALDEIELGKNS